MGKFNKTGKRGMPELNTSSLPDLIFTMLFFFMIVTTMREVTLKVQFQVPQGTELEKLEKKSLVSFIYIGKPLPEFQKKMGAESRIQLNDKFAEVSEVQDYIDIKQLKEKAKEFIVNPYDDEKLPEKHRKNIPLLGDCMITEKHVISVQNDVGTSYKAYIDVQNELVAAYNELRDELGKAKFGKTYAQCDEDEQKAIREYYPQKISEAEPKKYGGK